jgi:AcrR family transcriptional regulator
LLLSAAVAAFAEEGYAGASTRRIADRAGVSEVMIFRYFKSKAGLFHCAVVEPVLALAGELEWCPDDADGDPVNAWLRHVLDVVRRNQSLLAAVLNQVLLEDEAALTAALHATTQAVFAALEKGAVASTGIADDYSVVVRASFAMAVSMIVGGRQESLGGVRSQNPGRDREEIVRLLRDGIASGKRIGAEGNRS